MTDGRRDGHRPFFESHYDGTTYRQAYRLDPRLLVPGIMLTVFSIPLVVWMWPELRAFAVSGSGLGLVTLGFVKRHRFSVSPQGYCISRAIGPIGWTTRVGSDDATPVLASGRHGTYMVKVRHGWRTLNPLIEVGGRREGEAWIEFLSNVSHGVAAKLPEEEAGWPIAERT